jgi:thiamine phosphate synthase YjbQ (UPF0047 family)
MSGRWRHVLTAVLPLPEKALMINEWQDALVGDLKEFLQSIVDDRAYLRHNDPEHSDCVRSNATSHLRSAVLTHNVMVPIEDGHLALDPIVPPHISP